MLKFIFIRNKISVNDYLFILYVIYLFLILFFFVRALFILLFLIMYLLIISIYYFYYSIISILVFLGKKCFYDFLENIFLSIFLCKVIYVFNS